ncbi:MAG TPA: hypothetical protein VME46_04820 [Acidimicrobiales bacterium]|nr:hypothetical protein [Acidimicrobiales bacterium]
MRDYVQWHKEYDDPGSELSWRLRTVQGYISAALDERAGGPVQVVSLCAGEGRDIVDVLSRRPDALRAKVTLIELHPEIAAAARRRASGAGLPDVEVRVADAGSTDSLQGAVPADLVLLVGIFGNISEHDITGTVAAVPQFCKLGATILWSRGRDREDINGMVRSWFRAAGCSELAYDTLETGSRPAAGAFRFTGQPQPLVPGQRLFSFLR